MSGLRKQVLQELALERLADAELLLAHGRSSAAFYLAGYSVEAALKAVIAGRFQAAVLPERKTVIDAYTHDLKRLVTAAGLEDELGARLRAPSFRASWAIVVGWSPDARYAMVGERDARDLVAAIATPQGVLEWVRTFW